MVTGNINSENTDVGTTATHCVECKKCGAVFLYSEIVCMLLRMWLTGEVDEKAYCADGGGHRLA